MPVPIPSGRDWRGISLRFRAGSRNLGIERTGGEECLAQLGITSDRGRSDRYSPCQSGFELLNWSIASLTFFSTSARASAGDFFL